MKDENTTTIKCPSSYLDESLLIFLKQISLGWYLNEEYKIILPFEHIKKIVGDILFIEEYLKNTKSNNAAETPLSYGQAVYEKTIKSLLFLECQLGFKFRLFYKSSLNAEIFFKGNSSSNEINPNLQELMDELNSFLNFNTIKELINQENYISKIGLANFDASLLSPLLNPERSKKRKSLIDLVRTVKEQSSLFIEISSINKQTVDEFLKDYIELFKRQDLKDLKSINNTDVHNHLLAYCINCKYGEGKTTKGNLVELNKSEIAYHATNMNKLEHQDISEYRMLEHFQLLETNEDIKIENIEPFTVFGKPLFSCNEVKSELKIKTADWYIRFKLLKPLEEIVSGQASSKIKINKKSRIVWVNGKKKSFKEATPLFNLLIEAYENINNPVYRRRVIEVLNLAKETNKSIKSENNEEINSKVKDLRNKLGINSHTLTLNNGEVTLFAIKEINH